VIPAKRKLLDKLFQCDEQHLLQQVGTKATGSRNEFAQQLTLKPSDAEDEVCWVANMTADT
jgi:hypothetical protein